MTDHEMHEFCRWLLYGMHYRIKWPTRTTKLSFYVQKAQPPVPDEIEKHPLYTPFCFQQEVFWVVRRLKLDQIATGPYLFYHGPDDLLEDLETLWLLDSL